MSKISLAPNISGSAVYTIASPAGSTDRTLNLPDNSGTLLSNASTFAGTGPAFSVFNSAAQSLAIDTVTKVTFDTEQFDTNSNFASSRFTPTVAGYYQLSCGVRVDGAVLALHVQVRFNNTTAVAQGSFTNTTVNAFMSSCSGLAYLNGTTDYVEVYCYSGNAVNTNPGIGTVYFQGAMVRAA